MPSQSEKLRKVNYASPITPMHWVIKRVCSEGHTLNGDEGVSVAHF